MTALIIDYVLLKGIYEEVHFTLVLKCANLFHAVLSKDGRPVAKCDL